MKATYSENVVGESLWIRDENDDLFKGYNGVDYEILVQRYDDGSWAVTGHNEDGTTFSMDKKDIASYVPDVEKLMAEWWDEEVA